jgi:hypothetical protein
MTSSPALPTILTGLLLVFGFVGYIISSRPSKTLQDTSDMAFSGLFQPLGNPDNFNNVSLTPNCYFEVSNFRLDGMLNWALMSSYLERKSNRQNVFKLSLIGFHGKVSSNKDKAMAMVRTLYVSTFTQKYTIITGPSCS